MKSKQTLKIGDKVKVIDKNEQFFNKIGVISDFTIESCLEATVKFDNVAIDTDFFHPNQLQLITPKKSQWKYSREELIKWMSNGIRLNYEIYKRLLAKSTPKKKSKEIKEIEFEDINEIEEKIFEIKGINSIIENLCRFVGFIGANQNRLIRNQKKLQDTINLLIKNK